MWGLSFLFIKVAVPVVAPLWIVAARCLVGAAVLLVVLRVRGTALPRGLRSLARPDHPGGAGQRAPVGLDGVGDPVPAVRAWSRS